VAGSSTSNWSSTAGPVTIGAPTGGNKISGTVTFGGTATGPLYVGFYDQDTGNIYAGAVASPKSPQSYSVQVPTGSNYYFFGMIDQNKDGLICQGDISNTNANQPPVAITGAMTNENLTLSSANSLAVVRTNSIKYTDHSGTNTNYNIDLRVDGLIKLPVAVQLVSGPNVAIPVDIASGAFNGYTDEFDYWSSLNGKPKVGDSYGLKVTYSDGTSETLTAKVSAVLSAFATNLSPTGSDVSTTPNFSWTDPASASSYVYQFKLKDSNHNTIWQISGKDQSSNGFPYTIHSITWGVDPTGGGNTPTVSSLSSSATYNWQIQAYDANGNEAQTQVSFQTAEVPLSLPPSGTVSALISEPFSQSLNASGGSGSGYSFTVAVGTGQAYAVPTNNTPLTLTDGLSATNGGGNTLTISGTPTSHATISLTVSVNDSASNTAQQTYTIDVISGPNGAHNSYLKGTYVCKTDGFNDGDGSRWTSLTSFQVGGNGNLTNGVWDMNSRDQTTAMSGTMTGSYSVGADNNGLLTTNALITSGGTGSHALQFAIALTNAGEPANPAQQFRMVEVDDVGASPSGMHSSGNCYLATTAAFAASTISGKSFAFGLQGENGSGTPKAKVGRFSASGGNIPSGYLDGMKVSDSGDNGGAFTGSYTAPSTTTGRFTLTITPTGGSGSATFAAYIIDANRMFLLETGGDSGVQAGDMRKQQQTSYSGANLDGPFVVYSQGYVYKSEVGYTSMVLQGAGDGKGNMTINQSYQNNNGDYKVGDAAGGPIAVTFDHSNPGRVTFSTGTGAGYLYLFNNNAGFFLDLDNSDGNSLQTGWTEAQTQTTFTDAAVAGNYMLGQLPLMNVTQNGNVGELNVSSSGVITGGLTEAGEGDFSYDQSQSIGTLSWDSTAPGTGTFLIGSGDKGVSCAVISATKAVCIINGDSSPSVLVLQQ
jgi:hypothetical protein